MGFFCFVLFCFLFVLLFTLDTVSASSHRNLSSTLLCCQVSIVDCLMTSLIVEIEICVYIY